MASATEICNFALSHLGVSKEIASLQTEKSAEASACRRFYDLSLESTLRDFAWPFATKIETLGLVEENPNTDWGYSHRYPTDCLDIRRILSGIPQDTRDSRIPYKIGRDDSGLVVWSNLSDVTIEYTARSEDPSIYPADFILAFSLRLAMHIAPRVISGDPFQRQTVIRQLYVFEISQAKSSAINEEQQYQEPDSEFIRHRE